MRSVAVVPRRPRVGAFFDHLQAVVVVEVELKGSELFSPPKEKLWQRQDLRNLEASLLPVLCEVHERRGANLRCFLKGHIVASG